MRARARRRYTIAVVATELGFAIAAFGCGVFDAPLWLAGLAAAGMLAYWTWTRRAVLNRMRSAEWALATTVGVAVIIAIQVGAYWLGLVSGRLI